MRPSKLVIAAAVTLIGAGLASSAQATPQLLKGAKAAGLPAQNCQYCHVSKIPKKDGFTPADLNERGKWLMAEQEKTKAPQIKADWLKNYPGK